MARDYRRPAAAARALVATYGDHHVLAVSRRASARPERVDHQIEMPAPVEAWPRAHRADHAADQHRDVGRLYAGTDRPRAPGASGQLSDDRDQLVLLGLRFGPGRLRITARQRVLNPDVPAGRLRDTAQQPLDQRERFSAGLERLARPPGEQAERLTDQLRQQRLLGREVPVDGAHADARVARDIVDLRIGAALRERRSRALEDPLAIAAGSGRSVSSLTVLVTALFPSAGLTSGIIVHYSRGCNWNRSSASSDIGN